MDKAQIRVDPKNQGIRILDISGDQLPALIRLGLAPSGVTPPSPRKSYASADKKFGLRQRSRLKKTEVKDATVWRRWRAKIPFGDTSQKFEDETHKRGTGYSDAWQAMKNRQTKFSGSNVNMMNYKSTYNNIYNGYAKSQNDNIPVKKYNPDQHLCRTLKSNLCMTFKDYCDQCTIHGLKYIGDTALSSLERIFWILSFILAIMGAGYFIWHLYSKFGKSPIIISRSSITVSLDEFPFPAVTVCNMNNAKKSVAQQILKGNDSLQKFYLDDICNFKNGSSIIHYQLDESAEEIGAWENIYQFLLNVSQSCPQMLNYCRWKSNSTNCSEIFNPVLTDEGLCCKFNSLPDILYDPRVWENLDVNYATQHIDWTPEYKFRPEDPADAIPLRAFSSGAYYGLTLALDVNAEEYFCSSTTSVGFKMLLHSPVEMPQIMDFAFTLSPGKETRVIITPHITDADKTISKILPKIRHCYFLGEKNLRYYRTYTQRNCVLECEANFTLNYCKCMQYYMPATNNTRICGKNDDDCADLARRIMKDKSFQDEESRAAYNITETLSCKCYPGCNEINYSTEISQSMLMTTFMIPSEYYKNDDDYFEKNIAVVHIFFIDTSYMKYTKNELYGFAELLSNTGGLLGLFMGFSLLSVTEIFYYFAIRMWWRFINITKKRNKNKGLINAVTRKHDSVYPFAQ